MENTKPIIIVKPGTINDVSRKAGEDAGYVFIEHENPEDVKIMKAIITETPLESNILMIAAIEAISYGIDTTTSKKFVSELNRLIKQNKPPTV